MENLLAYSKNRLAKLENQLTQLENPVSPFRKQARPIEKPFRPIWLPTSMFFSQISVDLEVKKGILKTRRVLKICLELISDIKKIKKQFAVPLIIRKIKTTVERLFGLFRRNG